MKLTADGLLVELSEEEFDKHVPDLVTQGFLYSLRTGVLWSKSRDRVMGEWFPALRYNGWRNTDESLRKGRSFFINPSILLYLGTSPDELLKQDLIEKAINILKHRCLLDSSTRARF